MSPISPTDRAGLMLELTTDWRLRFSRTVGVIGGQCGQVTIARGAAALGATEQGPRFVHEYRRSLAVAFRLRTWSTDSVPTGVDARAARPSSRRAADGRDESQIRSFHARPWE